MAGRKSQNPESVVREIQRQITWKFPIEENVSPEMVALHFRLVLP